MRENCEDIQIKTFRRILYQKKCAQWMLCADINTVLKRIVHLSCHLPKMLFIDKIVVIYDFKRKLLGTNFLQLFCNCFMCCKSSTKHKYYKKSSCVQVYGSNHILKLFYEKRSCFWFFFLLKILFACLLACLFVFC